MQPKFGTVQTWQTMSGVGRSVTYQLLAAKKLHAVKLGKRTLIDIEAGLSWLAAQPSATIKA